MTPIFTISPYSPVSALKPKFSSFDSRILPITTAPSEPALSDGLKDARVNLLAADDRGAPAHRVGEELRNSRGLRRHGDTLALDLRPVAVGREREVADAVRQVGRSEERRVGKEGRAGGRG